MLKKIKNYFKSDKFFGDCLFGSLFSPFILLYLISALGAGEWNPTRISEIYNLRELKNYDKVYSKLEQCKGEKLGMEEIINLYKIIGRDEIRISELEYNLGLKESFIVDKYGVQRMKKIYDTYKKERTCD